ncbi:MAG TPA: glycosyl hydrolase [Bryobacteraceae bacterium]|nr:glycosyl hydrolase [Bryobacteraceae bacterium]
MRKVSSKAALAGTAILVSSGWLSSLASAAESPILEPASGAWLGLYYGAGTVAQTNAKLGRQPRIHLKYYSWANDWTGDTTKADLASGRIPLVNWEPAKIDFAKIADGSLDATILARAKGAKALGEKFFLDFAAEMNGDEAWSGNNAPLYVSAYRHIHDLFVAAGATNVVWAWCPNVTDTHGGNRTTMDYYPGDAYVDWTGVDGYNWGTKNGGWQSFEQVFKNIYPLLAAKKKPILIGETASCPAGGDKAKWIDAIIPTLQRSFPLIKGVVWFDINKECDWRISSSPEAERSFIRMMNDPYFNP